LALFLAITGVLVTLGASLEIDVIDGAIAGSKLFGAVLGDDIMMADKVLGAISLAVAYASFYFGAFFLAVACSDFAPELLAPGRIEHLLSLPVSRWQLLFGTYFGVITLAAFAVLYGACGLTVLLGMKTGLWSGALIVGAIVGWCGFCALYAAMLTSAFFVRSAALSAATGVVTLILGILSSYRETIAEVINEGFRRELFRAAMLPFPRLAVLATASANYAAGTPMQLEVMARLIVGAFVFSAALLAVAAWRFERSDY
jgi:ABC-type transport system involved in multi-copper enzyme maturation permease subunit